MAFWLTFFLWLAFTVVGELLRPKPKFGTPQPSALGDFQVPTAEEGRIIPIPWGTCLVKGPNVVWYGDLYTVAVKKKVKTGLWSSTKITLGYKYYMGQQLALCYGPVDDIIEVRFGDQKTTPTKTTIGDKVRLYFNHESLFGGITKDAVNGGGVVGDVDFYLGTTTQNSNDYLVATIGKPLPAYRGLCYAVFRRLYLGTSSYLKHPSFVIIRCPNQLGLSGGKHNINGDANAACMLYEILTDVRWGLGNPASAIDIESFISMGNTLHAEGLGLSMLIDQPMSANDLQSEILRHVDGVIYTDPETGLITAKLARKDYDTATLMVLDESCIEECDFTRGSWAETKNTVRISYTDRDQEYQTRVVQDQELANINGRGGEISLEQISFKGLSNKETAAVVAARVRKTVAYPLARARLKINRKAWKLRPGSVFKLTWSPLGISQTVMRVTRIRYGTLKNGWIEVDAVEDIFSVTSAAYTPPPDTEWINPYVQPQPAAFSQLIEAPAQIAGGEIRGVLSLAVRSNGIDNGYEIYSDPNNGTNFALSGSSDAFNATGTLITALLKSGPAQQTSLTFTGGRDAAFLSSASDVEFSAGASVALINNEILAWKTITDNGNGTFTLGTVWRGVMDTVPQDHSPGDRIWFLDGAGITDEDPYPTDVILRAKLLTRNLLGLLPIASAPTLTLTTTSRAFRPLPPGNVRINSISWPMTITDNAACTWARRHRTEQVAAQRIVAQDAADFSANIEGSYTVTVFVGGVQRQNATGITSTSYTYTATQRISDDADGTKLTRIRITPVNGVYSGTHQEREFIMTGFGMTFGLYFGGIQG